jgi:hypothetical protein
MVGQHRDGRRSEYLLPSRGTRIRRSSHILVEGQTSTDAIYTADALFRGLERRRHCHRPCRRRYADLKYAHDGRLERAVEVHSTWGTFEWILHDAFEKGYRVGVVCHSDDHKGRPGATRPGASSFRRDRWPTCYFMPDLTRDALFEALRQRRHYGTSGARISSICTLRLTNPSSVREDHSSGRALKFRFSRRRWEHHSPWPCADARCSRGDRNAPIDGHVLTGLWLPGLSSVRRVRSRAARACVVAGRRIPGPRPRDAVGG